MSLAITLYKPYVLSMRIFLYAVHQRNIDCLVIICFIKRRSNLSIFLTGRGYITDERMENELVKALADNAREIIFRRRTYHYINRDDY